MTDGVQLPKTIGDALGYARSLYMTEYSRLSPSTAQALLAYVAGKDRAWLFAHPEAELEREPALRFMALLVRAAAGEPLPHLTGEQEFYGLAFKITSDVLIPRPETEALVDVVLEWIADVGKSSASIIDVGTGSGAIAVTLAAKLPDADIHAVDVSPAAIEIAQQNARRYGVHERVRIYQNNLLSNISGEFDVIVANLPYISTAEMEALEVGRWEPPTALDGGHDGLQLIRLLLQEAPSHLTRHSLLALEIGYDQGSQVVAMCETVFPEARTALLPDLAGLDRIVRVIKP